MSQTWRPVDPDDLAGLIAERIAARPGLLRVAIDGALAARPHEVAALVLERLHTLGRPAVHIQAETFWRDASLRLEYGHTDIHSFRHDWLDVPALRREVLDPLGPDGSGEFLTSLRDPDTNRATRAPRVPAADDQVILVSGELLLDHDLPFDLAVALVMSSPALQRHTPSERGWTLPAFADYVVDADIVIKLDDPRHPAVRG